MKHINLNSLIQAYENLDDDFFKRYLDIFGIEFDKQEIKDLSVLLKLLKTNGVRNLDNFFIGYTINQISKQFDLLRFGTDSIVNIELKRKSTPKKIEKQLIQNRYYLQFLEKAVHTFTFVSETADLYKYDQTGTLTTTTLTNLVSILDSQSLEDVEDIHSLFKPSNYLVSPFNSTNKFIRGEYFLTEHQNNIKKDIINLFSASSAEFVSVIGKPGTGKTLLTYDLANHYINNKLNVLIVHCGKLNDGHTTLQNTYQWKIQSIKQFSENPTQHKFDILIVDEAQRLQQYQLDTIEIMVNSLQAKCIFSYDPAQIFTKVEANRNIGYTIEQKLVTKTHRLTDKIRTNKEIASFIVNLFDLSKINSSQTYRNINVHFFNDYLSAKNYADNLSIKGWEVINFTNSLYYRVSYDGYQSTLNRNSHDVIGQEYDNVAVFIDEHLYYNTDKKLAARSVQGGAYAVDKMLYQNLTRTREKLNIIVIKNHIMLLAILDILFPKSKVQV
ncbi:DNA/RNA helicase domain-containing protein [Bacillus sp. V5-8f]|uniref:DNA/RNA helicase domain-containing protein n=1 Tax=Bacillus sp. V5-8f TaxID=2053044 RepID=UPI0015E12E05|nr:DNA/RNA helicase domain-containing protein [Bacillus sp. V5-8f]